MPVLGPIKVTQEAHERAVLKACAVPWSHRVEIEGEEVAIVKFLNSEGRGIHFLDDHEEATHVEIKKTTRKQDGPAVYRGGRVRPERIELTADIVRQIPEERRPPGWSERSELIAGIPNAQILGLSGRSSRPV